MITELSISEGLSKEMDIKKLSYHNKFDTKLQSLKISLYLVVIGHCCTLPGRSINQNEMRPKEKSRSTV